MATITLGLSLLLPCARAEEEAAPSSLVDEAEDLLDIAANTSQEHLFYDAKVIGFDRKNNTTLFEGDVVVIGAGTIISADYITLHRKTGKLMASGHVVVLTKDQVFTGKTLEYHWDTENLKIQDGVLLAYDEKTITEVTDRVLGFTPKELYFETQRERRLTYLRQEKTKLLDSYRATAKIGDTPPEPLVDSYALLLEQEDLAEEIPNTALAKLSEKRRESFRKRRSFWEKSKSKSEGVALGPTSYFRIEGKTLKRTFGNDFMAEDAYWTACKCDEDEEPVWAFSARQIDAQTGGYVDLTDAVLEIKGLPILYLPRVKVPIKGNVRQSGFLFPTLRTGDSRFGSVYTQPVYFAFADNMDATLTTDFFQQQGTRIRAEGRYQQNKYDRLTLNLETIRDKTWIDQRTTRKRLTDYYTSESYPNPTLPQLATPMCDRNAEDYEACIADRVTKPLAMPPNTWRGSQEWQGQFHITPRIMVASEGQLRSDHRYVEDLRLTDDFLSAFSPAQYANSFNTVRHKVAYEGTDFYAGLTSSYGDDVLIPDDRFAGMQIPGRIDIASRYVSLNYKDISPIPLYGNLEFTMIPIEDNQGSRTDTWGAPTSLGSGRWQKFATNLVAPLKKDGIFTLDYFGDAQTRRIRHSGPGKSTASMHSFSSGISFNLPIDGVGMVPEFFKGEESDSLVGRRFIHHSMNWNMSFSTRPTVIRRGDYGDYTDEKGAPLVYFGSDRKTPSNVRHDPTDSMQVHKTISFGTSHSWSTYKKNWELLRGSRRAGDKKDLKKKKPGQSRREQYNEEARRALEGLMLDTDKRITDYRDMITQKRRAKRPKVQQQDGEQQEPFDQEAYLATPLMQEPTWHINRYRLIDENRIVPLSLSAGISYDFEQEKRRREQIKRNEQLTAEGRSDEVVSYFNLPRPWSGPHVNAQINVGQYSLNVSLDYNLYERTSRNIDFSLGIPGFYETSLALTYSLGKNAEYNAEEDSLLFRKTGTAQARVSSALIPYIHTDLLLIQKTVEGQPKPSYETQFGISYMSDSDCWGLRFLRSKPLNVEEKDANYLVQLTIIFLGQSRSLDVFTPLVRELKGENP